MGDPGGEIRVRRFVLVFILLTNREKLAKLLLVSKGRGETTVEFIYLNYTAAPL